MEIPYEVKPRPDTGLWNAKIGIWLFLASEVMLFGGLFSGYVFLRLGSGADPDYHWPHGLLDVKLGLINTLVLIASSVFVVMAWVKLKLRDWNGFRNWMIAVLLCALGFLGIKSYEYYSKFTHYGAKLSDKTVIEGHRNHDTPLDAIAYDDITEVTLNLPITDLRIDDIAHGESRGQLFFRVKPDFIEGEKVSPEQFFETAYNGLFAGKGYKLTDGELAEINEGFSALEKNVGGSFKLSKAKLKQIVASINAHRKAQLPPLERARKAEYESFQQANTGVLSKEQEAERLRLARPIKWYPKRGLESLGLEPVAENSDTVKPFSIATERSKLRSFSEDGATLFDQTILVGKLSKEKRFLVLDVDNIDLRSTPVPENSIIWQYMDPHAKEHFIAHRDEVIAEAKENGKEPDTSKSLRSHQEKHDGHYPTVVIPFDQVTLYSNFTPKWNTYLAVYFTLTGLHGLHVLIGALVLAYFLFFGKKMFDTDPDHIANRVEVGGLFWHFVDLVWIFLFPILYLM
ncbi:MAG: cytochrome c oxidase subunit 3 [Verrucomicrobiales bacterium]